METNYVRILSDEEIIALYWERNENAIKHTDDKYRAYLLKIANNILKDMQDSEECLNDTYLAAWNSIPPHRPNILSTYLGKITRHLSFDKFRHKNADKRGGGEIAIVLDELAECVSGTESVEDEVARKQLVEEINAFLNTLPQEKCNIFLCRYWYAIPVSEIAKRFGMTENNVSVTLNRMRKNLKTYLTERGYDL